jgi:hypothetical protein
MSSAGHSTKRFPHPIDFSSMTDHQRIIHLTEVSALDFPAADHYKYKCRLQVLSQEGESLLERDLLNRTQPSWLVDLKNKGDCTIAITLRYREALAGCWNSHVGYTGVPEWRAQRRVRISDRDLEPGTPVEVENSHNSK